MGVTYHLVPADYFDALDERVDYAPRDLAQVGFIHCTDGESEMARTANRYYRSTPGAHYYLYIDKAKVRAPIRFDDAAQLYPHIYGTLNRDAILAVRPAVRDADGTFHAPEPLYT
jgi:glutathione S-transferase